MKTKQRLSVSILVAVVAASGAVIAQGMATQSASLQEATERRVKLSQERAAVERARMPEIGEAFERLGDKQITGAPFSAQVVIESTQTLSNGSHITNKATGALYRDSEGRTRRDLPRDGAAEIALINDPVAGVTYRLNMFDQTALKFTPETSATNVVSEKLAKEMAEHQQAEKREMLARKAAPEGGNQRVDLAKKIEDLGTQTIEGVQAAGTRLTISVPPGMAGNDTAFDIVSERWYSPQLQTLVMTRRNDPRSGETVYRLTSINLAEPSRSLFDIPAGFTVHEEKAELRRQQ